MCGSGSVQETLCERKKTSLVLKTGVSWSYRSLLTQEGICMQLQPNFHFLEVAYPYVARRLLTDEDPALRERLFQV